MHAYFNFVTSVKCFLQKCLSFFYSCVQEPSRHFVFNAYRLRENNEAKLMATANAGKQRTYMGESQEDREGSTQVETLATSSPMYFGH